MAGDVSGKVAVGKRLEIARRSLKISQEVIAERILPLLPRGEDMTGQKWNNYAKGRDLIPVYIATAVCIVSGVDLDFIYRNEWGGLRPEVADRLHTAMT